MERRPRWETETPSRGRPQPLPGARGSRLPSGRPRAAGGRGSGDGEFVYAALSFPATTAGANCAAAYARAAPPSRRRASPSAMSSWSDVASAPGSPRSTSSPVTRPRSRRPGRRPPSRPPGGRRPSPRARRSRSPRAATGRRRPPRARSTARAAVRHEADRLGQHASGPAPTITRGRPSVAARNSWIPFSGERRPTKSTCGGSSGSPTARGSRRRSGSLAPRARRARAPRPRGTARPRSRAAPGAGSAGRATARAAPARRRFPRAGRRTASRSRARRSRRGASARGRGPRPARPAAPRARSETRKAGSSSASHGRRRRLPTIPCP